MGLQGSYRRGEATPASDVDLVMILDRLTFEDLSKYRKLVRSMPYQEKACGFISGKAELLCWDTAELFQFYYDTQPMMGSLEFLLPLIDQDAIRGAVISGVCGLYHACCHGFLFERPAESLPALRKQLLFLLRAKVFLEQGIYADTLSALVPRLEPADQEAYSCCVLPKTAGEAETDLAYQTLLRWSSHLLTGISPL